MMNRQNGFQQSSSIQFYYKITFVNSKHMNTNSKDVDVRRRRTYVLKKGENNNLQEYDPVFDFKKSKKNQVLDKFLRLSFKQN